MEVANRPASGTEETYDEWLLVQKASVLSYYTTLVKVSPQNCVHGNCGLDANKMSQKITRHLNEYVAVTIVQLKKLMHRYKEHDISFALSITSIIDRLVEVVFQNDKIFIPVKLRDNIMYLCYILPSEYFDHKKDEENRFLQKALTHMRNELHQKTHNAYLYSRGGGLHLLLEGAVPSPASQCDVNPYVI